MSLTGLFLILFLVVHLSGNFQLLKNDGGQAFNEYTYFMTHNPLIIFISYGNYFFIILHAVLGLYLASVNTKAKGSKYATSPKHQEDVTWASKNMALLGTLVLAFIFLHMGDFWLKMKLDQTPMVDYGGGEIKDLYASVSVSFSQTWIVIAYVIGLIALAYHLWHGFASAFKTLGLQHKKYNGIISGLGKLYAIIIPLLFASLPLYFYFFLK